MPPDDPLRPAEVAALEAWVSAGGFWPDDAQTLTDPSERAKSHWAYLPVAAVEPPRSIAAERVRTPIDRFILEKLDANGLSAAGEADRRTLIRRLSYDLTGLPPSAEEVEAFARDPSPSAYDQLVERLLASPHYGEHQARRWLDVARYADTKGYVYAREHRVWVHAATYRDWVVRAFNDDLPYDRFLSLQIASDQAAPDDPSAAAAMGFLTIGRRFIGVTHEIIDDRIDVVTRTTMGLTVACARCHDHKYDPVPTSDYYALYGVFLNSREDMLPTVPASTAGEAADAFEVGLATRWSALRDALATRRREASERVRAKIGDYLVAQTELEKYPAEGFDQILGPDDMIPTFIRRFETFLRASERANGPVFAPWKALENIDPATFATDAPVVLAALRASGRPVNSRVLAALDPPPTSMTEVARRYGSIFGEVESTWKAALSASSESGSPLPSSLSDVDLEQLRQVLHAEESPCMVPDEPIVAIEGFFPTNVCEELWKLQGEVDRWLIEQPAAPPYAVRLVDRAEIRPSRVFRRGDPKQAGEEVPRGFLTLLSQDGSRSFRNGSGRLELAERIVDPANPLTARVWVNRLWQQHFQSGLVETPSDFGLRATPPSHPTLLDWLARELVASGWSTKHIHRIIVGSSTYRQRSDPPLEEPVAARASQRDPDNRLLWRMNPRRLGFEEYRDTLLAVTGRLDPTAGGRASDLFAGRGLDHRRRSLYGTIDRQFFPTALRVFDVANPDLHVPRRSETTVPQQALFALNHPLVAEHARALASLVPASATSDEAVRFLYRRVLQRDPTDGQRSRATTFLADMTAEPSSVKPESLVWQYGYGTLQTDTGSLSSFTVLPHFTGSAWQGGDSWPDAVLGWARLTADGGHPGNDLAHAVVRRWTAPHAGSFTVESTVIHDAQPGDGVRCHILVRGEPRTTVTVHRGSVELGLEPEMLAAGDTIDFVVDIGGILNSDDHRWSPIIRDVGIITAGGTCGVWNARLDFTGPQPTWLSRLEQLAQVLLISNETVFID